MGDNSKMQMNGIKYRLPKSRLIHHWLCCMAGIHSPRITHHESGALRRTKTKGSHIHQVPLFNKLNYGQTPETLVLMASVNLIPRRVCH
jgi:hypothetical protein